MEKSLQPDKSLFSQLCPSLFESTVFAFSVLIHMELRIVTKIYHKNYKILG